MKRIYWILPTLVLMIFSMSLVVSSSTPTINQNADSLRAIYSRPSNEWPKATIDTGVIFHELAAMPKDSSYLRWDSDPIVQLGKILFFDPRLSESNQVSCSSCHDPDIAWTDARKVSLGHDHLQGTRNTPTILNVFIHKKLFWDGRADGLESQAINPIATHHEMNMEPPKLAGKLDKIKGYPPLFAKAFGDDNITLDRITTAIAEFERTIKSKKSRFDQFMEGKHKSLSDQEIRGLHLFRTKARCINCHNGAFFTDGEFHNIGLTYYGRQYEDLGLYKVTNEPGDVGKFRTPSLRDVMHTKPWMHNGLFSEMMGIVNIYNSGMGADLLKRKPGQENDPLFPTTDRLVKRLNLTEGEKEDLVAFIEALSGSTPYKMPRPKELPQ
ncbi:cytochrome c peroxidase [Chitinophaga skermanii]|uniref:Methylamine utilization protein MauG n=1 Tax=Chitinophaga skermanii TaxID=331697 RepID=A0A327Q4W0_9BACT|nr:cytochrome c peroxidase [Chitinophaga skermanii]RAI99478.1 cytochrome c peroxidase [Chitinophaga skermanii]